MLYSIPPVTRVLIVINVTMFIAQALIGNAIVAYLALWPIDTASLPGRGLDFAPWQLITYSFLHGSALHLFFNMFALFMFGGELERLFGLRRYLNRMALT